jgi:general secretion pathway protein G
MVVQKQSGFTLMEILIAVAIIGLMVAAIGPRIMRQFAEGKTGAAKNELAQIKSAVGLFYADMGKLPNELQDLRNEKFAQSSFYLPKDPVDPFKNPYIYEKIKAGKPRQITNKKSEISTYRSFFIYSYGENGEGAPEEEWIHDGE